MADPVNLIPAAQQNHHAPKTVQRAQADSAIDATHNFVLFHRGAPSTLCTNDATWPNSDDLLEHLVSLER